MMTDESGPESEEILSTEERLQLHQLRLIEWLEGRDGPDRQDQSGAVGSAPQSDLPTTWNFTGDVKLYTWQLECIDRWFAAGRRGTVKVVTGAGKTLLALAIAERLQNRDVHDLRVAVVVPTIVLMSQWYEEILERGNLPGWAVGRLGGGYRDDLSKGQRILITVLASAHKELPRIIENAGVGSDLLLVADECHRFGAEQMSKVFSTRRSFTLGLSATPERDEDEEILEDEGYEKTPLGRELGGIVYEFRLSDALRLGIVPTFTVHHYGLPLNQAERQRYDQLSRAISDARTELGSQSPGRKMDAAFYAWARRLAKRKESKLGPLASRLIGDLSRRKALLNRLESRGWAVENLLQREFKSRSDTRAILFHESIDEVMRLYLRLRKANLSVIAEHSELPTSIREEGFELFRKGVARIIVSARSLIEGFNVPAADVGIIVASTSSVRQRIQTLGRVLRRHRGTSGEEKTSHVHVLYARNTVEEAIYQKVDWDRMTGLDRNVYYTWTPGEDAVRQDAPPRKPLPKDVEVDPSSLRPGDFYPGRYEGEDLTCDTQRNISNEKGEFARNASDLAKLVLKYKRAAGRFRITPREHHVLVRNPENEEWVTRFVTRLEKPLEFDGLNGHSNPEPDIQKWIETASPGDRYPFSHIPVVINNLKFKSKKGGVIAKKIKGGEVFARTDANASVSGKGADARRLIETLQVLAQKGDRISSFLINEKNHALFRRSGQLYYLCALSEGLEFPE